MHVGSKGRRRVLAASVAALALTGSAAAALAALSQSGHAGPQGDGTALTPTGWRITPLASQVQIVERPYAAPLSPDGAELLVSNDGTARQSLMAVDTAAGAVTQTLSLPAP